MAVSPGGRPMDTSPFSASTDDNWVARAGGLPEYVRGVSHALLRTGRAKNLSQAVRLAVGAIRNWAEGRTANGKGRVHPAVQAAAAAALADWEAKRAKAHAHANTAGHAIELVGPKGYEHGWIFVGVPTAGEHVYHPRHGPGTITHAGDHHVSVAFGKGGQHDFPVRRAGMPSHFERMNDRQLTDQFGRGDDRLHAALAELDRREAADKAEHVRSLYATQPKTPAERDQVYGDLVKAGENPEDAWAHAHGVSSEQMQRKAAVEQLRAQGYRGKDFDSISRAAFRDEVHRQAIAAETATNGFMLNPAGKKAGIDPWSLLTGPESRARKYASPELREYWDMNGRPTVADFQEHLLGHAGTGGPRGGDFLR